MHQFNYIILEDEPSIRCKEVQAIINPVKTKKTQVGWHCAPWEGDFESCVEVSSEGCADSLICVDLD